MYEVDRSKWEMELEKISKNNLKKFVPEISSRTALTDKVGLLVLHLIQNGVCEAQILGSFKFGGTISGLSDDVVNKWLEFLLTKNDIISTLTILDLFHSFYIHKKDKIIPLELAVEILTHSILQNSTTPIHNPMIDLYWSQTAKSIIEQSAEHGLKIMEVVIRNFETDSFYGRYDSQIRETLDKITEEEPHKIWKIVSKYLGPPVDSRAFNLKNWLRGGLFESNRGILEYVPFEEICEWIEEDRELRSRYLATFVKPEINTHNSLAYQVLVKYGNDKKVRLELIRNFFSESWRGPASEHYAQKKQQILQIKQNTTNQNVLIWIEEYIQFLDHDIERSKYSEEREF